MSGNPNGSSQQPNQPHFPQSNRYSPQEMVPKMPQDQLTTRGGTPNYSWQDQNRNVHGHGAGIPPAERCQNPVGIPMSHTPVDRPVRTMVPDAIPRHGFVPNATIKEESRLKGTIPHMSRTAFDNRPQMVNSMANRPGVPSFIPGVMHGDRFAKEDRGTNAHNFLSGPQQAQQPQVHRHQNDAGHFQSMHMGVGHPITNRYNSLPQIRRPPGSIPSGPQSLNNDPKFNDPQSRRPDPNSRPLMHGQQMRTEAATPTPAPSSASFPSQEYQKPPPDTVNPEKKVVKKRCNKEKEAQWMNQYNALKEYHQENGHSNVPMHFSKNKRLGHWVNNQRQLYRKHKSGKPSSMSQERIKLLENLDFIWVLGRDWKHRLDKSKNDFNLKKDAKRKNADISPNPSETSSNYEVSDGPLQQNIGKGDGATTTTPAEAHSSLDQETKRPKMDIPSEITSNNIPQNPQIDNQSIRNNDSTVQVNTTTTHGFGSSVKFTFKENTAAATTNTTTSTPSFENNDTSDTKGEPTQEDVVPPQTLSHQDPMKNSPKQPTTTTPPQSDLHNLKFPQNSRSTLPTTNELNSSVKNNSEIITPSNSNEADVNERDEPNNNNENPTKASGPLEVKTNNNDGEHRGPGTNIVSPSESSEANTGVDNRAEKISAKNEGFDVAWSRRLDELRGFNNNNGHCDVPSIFPLNRPLGTWVMNQRQQYRKLRNGEKSSMTQERITALEKLGFRWFVGKGMRSKEAVIRKQENSRPNKGTTSSGEDDVEEENEVGKKLKESLREIRVGTDLAVFWDDDKQYYSASVKIIHTDQQNEEGSSDFPSIFTLKYEDGDLEKVNLTKIPFRIVSHNNTTDDGLGQVESSSTKSDQCIVPTKTKSPLFEVNDKIFSHIFSYIPTIQSLAALVLTSKQSTIILKRSVLLEHLMKEAYHSSFGSNALRPIMEDSEKEFFWKHTWENVYSLRHGIKVREVQRKDQSTSSQTTEETYKLSPNIEVSPFGSENNPDTYVGMVQLYTTFPSRLESSTSFPQGYQQTELKELLVTWGKNFDGIRVFDGPNNQTSCDKFHTIGAKEFLGKKISTIIATPLDCIHQSQYFLFCGTTSGAVFGISMLTPSYGQHKYMISYMGLERTSKVTAFSFITISNNKYLLSCGFNGKVYMHPSALSHNHQSQLRQPIVCAMNANGVPILSICEVKGKGPNGTLSMFATGDASGAMVLWRLQDNNFNAPSYSSDSQYNVTFEQVQTCRVNQNNCFVTQVHFIQNNVLVAGASTGEIHVWELNDTNSKTAANSFPFKKRPNFELNLRFSFSVAHGRVIDFISIFGNVLVTSGGNEGIMRCWDLNTGDLMGTLSQSIAIGDNTFQKPRVAVVGAVVSSNQRLLSLQRDGTVFLWRYGDLVRNFKSISKTSKKSQSQQRHKWGEDDIPIGAAALSTLAGTHKGNLLHDRNTTQIQSLEQLGLIMDREMPFQLENKFREYMRISIIEAAYQHATHPGWEKYPETAFVGADGKAYAYIKKAFVDHSGIEPCERCKRIGKNAYYCRLKMKHNDGTNVEIKPPLKDCNDLVNLATVTSAHEASPMRNTHFSKKPNERRLQMNSQRQLEVAITVKSEDKTWECRQCTFVNNSSTKKCAACNSRKVSRRATTPPKVAQKKSCTTWKCHRCTRQNQETSKRCRSCSAWKGGKRTLKDDSSDIQTIDNSAGWKCTFCQFHNAKGANICAMCHESITSSIANAKSSGRKGDNYDKKGSKENVSLNQKDGWDCHKCSKRNNNESKRCRACFAWKGGKRAAFGCKLKKK